MITFAQYLSESLSSTFPIESISSVGFTTAASFKDEKGVYYNVTLMHEDNIMEVMFNASDMYVPGYKRDHRSRSTSTTLKVYATIGQLIDSAIKTHKIHTIKFEAARDVMIPVYRKLADRIAKQHKGIVHQSMNGRFLIVLNSSFSQH